MFDTIFNIFFWAFPVYHISAIIFLRGEIKGRNLPTKAMMAVPLVPYVFKLALTACCRNFDKIFLDGMSNMVFVLVAFFCVFSFCVSHTKTQNKKLFHYSILPSFCFFIIAGIILIVKMSVSNPV